MTPGIQLNTKGEEVYGFRGRPRLKDTLAKENTDLSTSLLSAETAATTSESVFDYEHGAFQKEGLDSDSSCHNVPDLKPKTKILLDEEEQETECTSLFRSFNVSEEFQNIQNLFPSFTLEEEFSSLIESLNQISETNNVPERMAEGENMSQLSPLEENMMMKHFFKKLLPLLDAHPNSPWPQLALKYCDFEIAKSCFIALSCIHLYETKGAQEFYSTGMVHINNTMEYLINYLKSLTDNGDLDVKDIIHNLKKQSLEKQRSNFFVILLLIHVYLLFTVLESGRSALLRLFFQLASSIARDSTFGSYLSKIKESSTLVTNFAWFDTISSVVSADCRIPYCDENWYGCKGDLFSTATLIGCPGEIFRCIHSLCCLRRDLKESNGLINSIKILERFEKLKKDLLNYRDYVICSDETTSVEFEYRLKSAQCWSIAVLMNAYRLIEPERKDIILTFINEFSFVYRSMESSSPYVTQMVWPVFTFASVCTNKNHQKQFKEFIDELYRNAKMGTISTLGAIVQECWISNKSWEEILAGQEWLKAGIDFLVV